MLFLPFLVLPVALCWTNVLVERTLDVSKLYTKEIIEITAKNTEETPLSAYVFPILKADEPNLAMVLAAYQNLVVPARALNKLGLYNELEVSLPSVEPGEEITFSIQIVRLEDIRPSPDTIPLDGVQNVVVSLPRYVPLPYTTSSYKIAVVGASDDIKDEQGVFQSEPHGKFVTLTPKTASEIEPFAEGELTLLFEKNAPLPVAEKLDRSVWLLHWGDSISFEETYETTNKAAKLQGGFLRLAWMQSRYQYLQGPYVLAYDMELPRGFREAYFVDLVGNVSTSTIVGNHLILRPRYPLFGGWNYNFTVGWTNQLAKFVRKSDDNTYLVKVPLVNGHTDMSYRNVTLLFYLPENAKLVDFKSPIPYEDYKVVTEKSYFDFKGRSKLEVYYKNLVDEFKQSDVVVKYEYSAKDFWMKPVIVGGFLFVALMSYLLLTKVDVQIDKREQ